MDISLILKAHGVNPDHGQAICDFVNHGILPDKEVQTRLLFVTNYKQCLARVLAARAERTNQPPPSFEGIEV